MSTVDSEYRNVTFYKTRVLTYLLGERDGRRMRTFGRRECPSLFLNRVLSDGQKERLMDMTLQDNRCIVTVLYFDMLGKEERGWR